MCRIYHYHHYSFFHLDSTYQVLDSGCMNIYQLLAQVRNIQLLALENLAGIFFIFGSMFFLNFKYVSSSISTLVP